MPQTSRIVTLRADHRPVSGMARAVLALWRLVRMAAAGSAGPMRPRTLLPPPHEPAPAAA
ncbi:hypothetical protein D2T29_13965 [Sinirhodobacter populi]|uniref:Uncharacterized protein n=1 Tax=Paenirhodobacter populi TaxID=2306993 RepID=A0A443KB26_9RHOB|nr:hypothetical protein [Sinirhodobacter populi]RWR29882.1 hypothetical protein D2T29_13965 [Sinirhodobacter populi]